MDRILHRKVLLPCQASLAYDMFTRNEHLEAWLAMKADVEPHTGGKYELFWRPDDPENDSTTGCKILGLEKDKFISFEWKGAAQHKHFFNTARPLVTTTVFFISQSGDSTEVHLIQSGWRDGADWDEAYSFFTAAWAGAFSKLEQYVAALKEKQAV